jgi:branched-chain amino acid aminotransferase
MNTIDPGPGIAAATMHEALLWMHDSWQTQSAIPLQSSAVLYGASVFDSCRAWRGRDAALVYGLAHHLARFRRSAKLALLDLPTGEMELEEGIGLVLRKYPPQKFVRVRVLAFGLDSELCSERASVAIFALPVEGYAPPRPRLVTSMTRRQSSGELPQELKSPSRYLWVRREVAAARASGYDDVAVLNEHGRIAEASRANIIMLHQGTLTTPPVSEGALPGITKKILRHVATREGLHWETRPVSVEELERADGLLLTSSSLGVVQAQSFNGRQFGDEELTAYLCGLYQRLPTDAPSDAMLSRLSLAANLCTERSVQ